MERCTAMLAVMTALIVSSVHGLEPTSPQEALTEARALATERRFQEAFETLQPYLQDTLDSEESWEIAAEMGRAAFHTAQYHQALAILRKVVAMRPVILEPALYLGATSYLLGDRAQSLAVLEAVLQSGTVDLYRAMTLPGEDSFRAEPEVQDLLDRYSKPLLIDLEKGTCLGLVIGQSRGEIVERLGAGAVEEGSIAARAGPFLIWVWSFDDDNALTEVVLHTENLWRYTPFRVRIGDTVTWNSTPSDAFASLGPPQRSTPGDGSTLTLGWAAGDVALDLVFRRPTGDSQEPARLEIVRLFNRPQENNPDS
jgi:hypothetical protein